MKNVPDLLNKTVEISVLADVVTVSIHCGDAYQAQVLYDDMKDKMDSGDGIALTCKPRAASLRDKR